jgi:hypothetical protein
MGSYMGRNLVLSVRGALQWIVADISTATRPAAG